MCITRVGKILSVHGNRAVVALVGDDATRDIDISMVSIEKNSYVEVFADFALAQLSSKEARQRKRLWRELRKRAE
jgi:hydrogenase maturation factor